MIDLEQFKGIESSPWSFKTEEAGFQCVNFELVTSSNINFGKCGIEINLFSDGSNVTFPVPEKTKEMLLIEKAPELLQEIKNLRNEIFFLKQDIEEIEEREGEEIHSEKVWRSYVKEYFDSLDEMVQASKIELAKSEVSNDRFEKATLRLKLLSGLSPEKSTDAKLKFENGVFIEKEAK